MFAGFENDWDAILKPEMGLPYFQDLERRLTEEYGSGNVYPEPANVFHALRRTPFGGVKAVILGQDPYHGSGQAHGLSFSVKPGVKRPPSLQNIFKELQDDLGCKMPDHGCLEHWADQGVLLLNSVLTVRESEPNSHKKLGWERFTDAVIGALGRREKPLAFILWGRHAQEKAALINEDRHLIIRSAHPSPLSAYNGFFGSKPFSRTNAFLLDAGQSGIDWQIPAPEVRA